MEEATLEKDLSAFRANQSSLESNHMGKWVLFQDGKLISVFETSTAAAMEAVKKFGRGPYLIRQIGAPSVALPASVLFFPVYAAS